MIIGFVGFINSGKNTAAGFLQKYDFIEDSFANTLKDVLSIIFDWPRELLEGNTKESREWRNQTDMWWSEKLNIPNFTPRMAMQMIGTNVFRNHFNTNIWTLTLERRIQRYNCNVIIPDVRFQNEIDLIKRHNGKIIMIQKGSLPEWWEKAEKACHGDVNSIQYLDTIGIHPSEWSWIGHGPFDVITNNGTLDEFERKINEYIKPML
ncbi:MAG: hypothetical protein WC284_12675 [Candidimonas sp.]